MNEAELKAKFFAVVDSMELDISGVKELEPLDHKRDEIINSLVDHLQTFDDIDLNDEVELEETRATIEELVTKDFKHMEGIAVGDEVIASGETILMIIDREDEGVDVGNLADDVRLHGTIARLALRKIPALNMLSYLKSLDPGELNDDDIPTHPFGIGFEITNATIETEQGTEQLSEEEIVFLPLNYPQLHLRRFV